MRLIRKLLKKNIDFIVLEIRCLFIKVLILIKNKKLFHKIYRSKLMKQFNLIKVIG
ncbi:zinc finger domain protein, LSD1 subclass [Leptotrichia trevisanii]|uniref:Zinc finger domain protein, LSD1 subclass n=1 Tax=Leptotrichia trevisanii TaxID=109328 RepID=A0A510KZ96_9FUSO|nr:zinc finger domain protein, LSD1 subclass [Leptotrichia trevisanii]BBM56557.1 zinc finger domain protein, LSD1 subclass [Leptotrichia trevisanii]